MAQLLDGKTLAQAIRTKVKSRIQELRIHPGLAVILVGDEPASHLYVSLKQKACEEAGIRFMKILYPASVPESTLLEKIRELNARKNVHGILVQLPLPSQNADRVIAAIDPKKDVDGFHRANMQNLKEGKPGLVPAVALGIMKLIESAGVTGAKMAVVVGSQLFAEPLIYLLKARGIATTAVPETAPKLNAIVKTADIVITAVGRHGIITGRMIKFEPDIKGSKWYRLISFFTYVILPEIVTSLIFGLLNEFVEASRLRGKTVVIDVGTAKINGKLTGDVDAKSVSRVAGWLSPVPGGVGPMTVAMLLVNVVKACKMQT